MPTLLLVDDPGDRDSAGTVLADARAALAAGNTDAALVRARQRSITPNGPTRTPVTREYAQRQDPEDQHGHTAVTGRATARPRAPRECVATINRTLVPVGPAAAAL